MILAAILLVVWCIITYIIIKKNKIILPHIFLAIVTPFYEIIDTLYLVQIGGTVGSNIFRGMFYLAVILLMFIIGVIVSKRFEHARSKIIYIITIPITNIFVAFVISKFTFWA